MTRYSTATPFFLMLSLCAMSTSPVYGQASPASRDGNWPQFRGHQASGHQASSKGQGKLPTTWNGAKGIHIQWKTPIPGLGHSSPIIWGDRVFVTTAISGKKDPQLKIGLYGQVAPVEDDTVHTWHVYALDKRTGKILWEQTAHKGVPAIKRHTKSTHANSTPATDGKHVVAFFGSEGLYCYDFDGKLLWKNDLGVLDAGWYVQPDAQWEYGSSPIIFKNRVIVLCDVQGDSFLAAFDIDSGKELWRTPRDEVPTWGTPTVHVGEDRTQVIVNGYKHIGGYDVQNGDELWRLRGGGDIPAPTPVVADGLIYITNAHGGQAPIYAIRTNAEGDITPAEGVSRGSHLAWSKTRGGNYMQTPLVYGDQLYMCAGNGVVTCLDAKDGKRLYRRRLAGVTGFTASAVAGDGKIYFTAENGDVFVVQAGPKYRLLATNYLDEVCLATPAISDGHIYMRAQHHLYCIGE